jgi:hypothetical protein
VNAAPFSFDRLTSRTHAPYAERTARRTVMKKTASFVGLGIVLGAVIGAAKARRNVPRNA